MRSFHAVRSLALAVLLAGALLTSSCTQQPAGVGLGFTTPSPWNATPQMEITTTWDGGPMYWSP
ncbi:hypothetical protein [Comamonas sp. JC664]|uniref:hypothetical protein n=1 Tax=Comamonas sp. JC664 TaxID=2801917 RepID=UPI001747FA78|nr:hypothetical protein [Comamonas sp. JC664]MBL0693864.1 hypothetical protein [Comamonas sp. JC664]GHG74837.1 hypothetical protein GCM10012319_22930 [Comamonas sp. KCTC 72670]